MLAPVAVALLIVKAWTKTNGAACSAHAACRRRTGRRSSARTP